MGDLAAGHDDAVFDLDRVADAAVVADGGEPAHIAVGANVAVAADGHRAFDIAAAADYRARADLDRTVKDRPRLDPPLDPARAHAGHYKLLMLEQIPGEAGRQPEAGDRDNAEGAALDGRHNRPDNLDLAALTQLHFLQIGKYVGLEDVAADVGQIAEKGFGLLDHLDQPVLLVHHRDPVERGIGHRLDQGGIGVLQQFQKILAGEEVITVAGDKTAADMGLGLQNGMTGAQLLLLLLIDQVDASILVAEQGADHLLAVADDQDDLVKDSGHLVEAVIDQGTVGDRKQRLGPSQGQGVGAGALARHHHHCLHQFALLEPLDVIMELI
ncbi:MAG: hypothetical protein BWY77_01606 [bacterium ADurb.Bin431]|nr:MAG: hypothetical protein BWY77_01606 [bacterium ADurb.Bin431]